MNLNIIYLIFSLLLNMGAAQNYFTSLSKMENLMKTQVDVIRNIQPYINIVNDKVKRGHVQTYVDRCKVEQAKAEEDVGHYLGNPLNAFTLIKRLTADLQCVELILQDRTAYRRNDYLKYPSHNDLLGAMESLASLQIFYQLRISDLANGTLITNVSATKEPFIEYVTPLTASDCFQIGLVEYEDKDFTRKIAWMKEALKKFKAGSTMCDHKLVDIYDQISQAYYELGKHDECLRWVKKRVALQPMGHHTADYNKFIDHLKMKIAERHRDAIMNRTQTIPTTYVQRQNDERVLCAGQSTVTSSRRLKCYFATGPHPYLKLARIKSELLHLSPDITMYHQIMTNEESMAIQQIARPRLRKAAVTNSVTGEVKYNVDYRISQVVWLSGDHSDVVAKVTRRVSHVTGFNVDGDFGEDLQVANYGIAGCYLPHYDFTSDLTKRLASFMFYMSDVTQGGATTFPKLDLTIFPVKNSAIYWKNFHPSGEKDMDTIHSACPVIRGHKWVAMQWISTTGQELISPCPAISKLQ